MIFKDRIVAGDLLAERLEVYKKDNAIVMAIPRGGVPIGYVIAKKLHLPLEVVLSKKITHPLHKEYAIGAVTLNGLVLSDAALEVPKSYIEEETKNIRTLLAARYQDYYGKKEPLQLKDRVLIIVDDGIATGNTILSTLEMLYEEKPKKIVVAIPVASPNALLKLKNSAFIDEVICLSAPAGFRAVSQFYQNFDQVDDLEVRALLNKTTLA